MILALDIASRTGWAAGRERDAAPLTGFYDIQRAGGEALGPTLANFRDWLSTMISLHRPTLIVFEAPLNLHAGMPTTLQTVRVLLGLASVVELMCEDRHIDCAEVKVEEWRMHFLGRARRGRDDPKDILKRLCLERCRELGWDVRGHDAADAAGLWHFARSAA